MSTIADHNALTLSVDWHNSFLRYDKNKVLKPDFFKSEETTVYSAQALPAEHKTLCTAGSDCAQYTVVSWDMTKIRFKTLFLSNLKKQQCIRRSATCWAQNVVHSRSRCAQYTVVSWDMTKIRFKTWFLSNLKKQQCIRRKRYLLSTMRWNSAGSDCAQYTVVSWDMTK